MQGTRVRALLREDPTCHGATKLSLRSRARQPQLLSPSATTTEAHAPRARALQQEKPPQWEARAPRWRVAPRSPQLEKSPRAATKTQRSQK